MRGGVAPSCGSIASGHGPCTQRAHTEESSMRLVKVTAPRGKAAEIARLAFEQGIRDVTVQQVEQQKASGVSEPRDTVDAKVSTPQGKAFIDAVMSAPFFDRESYAIEIREPRSIVKAVPTREITRPV